MPRNNSKARRDTRRKAAIARGGTSPEVQLVVSLFADPSAPSPHCGLARWEHELLCGSIGRSDRPTKF